MNLRNAKNYTIGLDIGTGSVGWAVTDENGELYKFRGKNTWGSRLFDSASPAADTRVKRTLRRRYNRRKQRLNELQHFFEEEMTKVDPEFFIRMRQSSLVAEDREGLDHVLFPHSEEDRAHYESFPTIYHLRERLVSNPEKEDIRLVYLALHHMVKYRGNFLVEGGVRASDANALAALSDLSELLPEYCEALGDDAPVSFDEDKFDAARLNYLISESGEPRRNRQEQAMEVLGLEGDKKVRKTFADAIFGYETKFSLIFDVEDGADTKFNLDKEEKVEKFENEILPEEQAALFTALRALHSAYLLAGILRGASGKTLSSSMVAQYEQHKCDLALIKRLGKTYLPEGSKGAAYRSLFRGKKFPDGTYIKKKDKYVASGYTGYILGAISLEDFYAAVKKAFEGIAFAGQDAKAWEGIVRSMDEGRFMKKLRTRDNGAIPHQLHLEEMKAVIKNQGVYYPFLIEHEREIESLISFRLPYYVGPLGKEKNPARKKPFGWAVRRPGMEDVPVKPWNLEEVVDTDTTAEKFIENLTGECTYYLGKSVIPKNSLLYSEFCVRQELNNCRIAADGENFKRFGVEEAESIYQNVFKRKRKVKVSDVREYLKRELGMINTAMKGTQKENEFASTLKSYLDFKAILGRDIESFQDYEMVEELIAWATIFEDKKILRRKVERKYGPEGEGYLTADQIKRVCKLRYTGWSNLSKEFLTEIRAECEGRNLNIMDALRDSRTDRPMNLMEILADERFGFKEKLEKANAEYIAANSTYALDEIPGSPAIKRGINQSMKVVDEVVKIAGSEPRNIVIEMAREEVGKNKGSRTKTRERFLKERYAAISKDLRISENSKELDGELKKWAGELDSRRLYLYFLQRGKCPYCQRSLEIDGLNDLHIDHIVPQSLIKDDSIDNTVLVHHSCNEAKRDLFPLPEELRTRNYRYWRELREAGLISEKKFRNLTESQVSKGRMRGFINRQLVETRQISKHVVTLLRSVYPNVKVEMIKAELSSGLRKAYGFHKVRDVNDWHHAHDAYLAIQMSRFLSIRFKEAAKDLDYGAYTRYAKAMSKAKTGNAGLFVNSFKFDGFDKETGEVFRDTWDASFEIDRIRKCLNYKDCFVSRKVEKQTGAFWGETIYSPRLETKAAIPLKKGMDPAKYGYYQGVQSAFFALVRHDAIVRNKPKCVASLVGVPINDSYSLSGKADLQVWVANNYANGELLLGPIYKYQKIEWDGMPYYLTGDSEIINARQLYLPEWAMELLDSKETEGSNERLVRLFDLLRTVIRENYPRYVGIRDKLDRDETKSQFLALPADKKREAIDQILAVLHADARRGLAAIGLPAGAGRMFNLNIGGAIDHIVFCSTSVTGMFEKRFKVEL